jgi:hypothetical protein
MAQEYITWKQVAKCKNIAQIKELATLQLEAMTSNHAHPDSIKSSAVERVWNKGDKYSERGKEKAHATKGFSIKVVYDIKGKQVTKRYTTRAF